MTNLSGYLTPRMTQRNKAQDDARPVSGRFETFDSNNKIVIVIILIHFNKIYNYLLKRGNPISPVYLDFRDSVRLEIFEDLSS